VTLFPPFEFSLITVLDTHVDLLKNVMLATPQFFEAALGVGSAFHPLQFRNTWAVLMELARSLSRIWLPQRQTRLIADAIQVFVSQLPTLRAVFAHPPDVPANSRLGFVRLAIAELVSLLLSSRLVSLFVDGLRESGLMDAVLDACWAHPNASLFHLVVFGDGLLPLIRNCLSDECVDEVFRLASAGGIALLQSVRLVDRIMDTHYSYDIATSSLRNCFAHNGYMTQVANALVASNYPASEDVLLFVSTRLDWTNSVETTPITSCIYSERFAGVEDPSWKPLQVTSTTTNMDENVLPANEISSDDGEEESGSEEDGDDDDDLPVAVSLGPVRVLSSKRIDLLAENPIPSHYESPPRPRLPFVVKDSDELPVVPPLEMVEESVSGSAVEEGVFNEHAYWSLPIAEFD
jgi:hypothetical protein